MHRKKVQGHDKSIRKNIQSSHSVYAVTYYLLAVKLILKVWQNGDFLISILGIYTRHDMEHAIYALLIWILVPQSQI